MSRYAFLLVALALLSADQAGRAQGHAARGIVVQSDPAHGSIVVSCDAIAGYMAAMEMSMRVRDAKLLRTIHPGSIVQFTIIAHDHVLYAEGLSPVVASGFEPEQMDAGGLTTLKSAVNPASLISAVKLNERVPDFTLTDQTGSAVHLSQFEGKVVALTFGYSRCPNPDYCYRLSNNLAKLEKRFSKRRGRDLVLLTIAIDPEYDQGAKLEEYSQLWHANPADWHFVTGSVDDIRRIAATFGMNFWREEGLLTHSLHTVVINRQGRLAANIEGNQFTAQQLGDLVQTIIDRRP